MKKFFVPLLLTVLCCLSILGLAGCKAKVSTITDIDRYSQMTSAADKIDVCYDCGAEDYLRFTVTDEADIAEIMEILFSDTLSNQGKQLPPQGLNTFIVIYQGENSYSVDVHQIYYNQRLYTFSTSRLADKITALASAIVNID